MGVSSGVMVESKEGSHGLVCANGDEEKKQRSPLLGYTLLIFMQQIV